MADCTKKDTNIDPEQQNERAGDISGGAQTPQETSEAVSALAGELEEMDRAGGNFGEALPEELVGEVAGGATSMPNLGEWRYCDECHEQFYWHFPDPMLCFSCNWKKEHKPAEPVLTPEEQERKEWHEKSKAARKAHGSKFGLY